MSTLVTEGKNTTKSTGIVTDNVKLNLYLAQDICFKALQGKTASFLIFFFFTALKQPWCSPNTAHGLISCLVMYTLRIEQWSFVQPRQRLRQILIRTGS